MRTVRKRNLFAWTLRGNEYAILAIPSLIVLLIIIGVLL